MSQKNLTTKDFIFRKASLQLFIIKTCPIEEIACFSVIFKFKSFTFIAFLPKAKAPDETISISLFWLIKKLISLQILFKILYL